MYPVVIFLMSIGLGYSKKSPKLCSDLLDEWAISLERFTAAKNETAQINECYTMIIFMEDSQWPECIKNFDIVQGNIEG